MAWLVSLKILLISSGVVALALAMQLYVPLVFEFAVSNLPLIWSSCKSLLRPPYLYVVINAIIITIAASSMFHHDRPQAKLPSPESESTPPPVVYKHREDDLAPPVVYKHIQEDVAPPVVYEHREDDVAPPVVYKHIQEDVAPQVYEHRREEDVAASPVVYDDRDEAVIKEVTSMVPFNNPEEPVAEVDNDREDEIEVSTATWTTSENTTKFVDIILPAEKPLVSTRFSHRKPARSTPEGGRPLRVSKAPKRHDTLENTWKMITEGRAMPLSRHIKKSDTWDHHGSGGVNVNDEVDEETSEAVQQSKTFKDMTNQQKLRTMAAVSSSPGGIKLRKEPSLSQDDLNRRVEAFIQKFNEEMRLQRQESLDQYMEMINRGSH
ncbi:hypothetical protein RchiOBHm_Chr5g0006611 [Rosa chinensis]|uniref:DUF4408 domain-containing protein n=1 Tax=Rosa chinensis TaxID=74649 RepID=A0A2P6Q3K7_ROSCH|nr:uncharacterized protein LOC112166606 [Rosa chinensis]PRQ28771.1 hypothetical protein RchiOBHm_Chr5g0006611 [Rosa chinensis]